MVMIAATSDIHSPRYLDLFLKALTLIPRDSIKLFLLAGDLTDKGKYWNFDPIYGILKKFRIIATFGNEDFMEVRDKYKDRYKDVIWLMDSIYEDNIDGINISIIGSDGVLERPTLWQISNGINENFYKEKLKRIEELLCKSKGDIKILLTHYASSFETLLGERKNIYAELGFRIVDNVKCNPDIAIHGHAHYSIRTFYVKNKTKIYNVALPANKRIVIINLN
jgi:Icc-related predicted phosphoesterase